MEGWRKETAVFLYGLIVRPSSRRRDPHRDVAGFGVDGKSATGRLEESRRKAARVGEGATERGIKKRNSEFIDQRCRLAVSRHENAEEKKRDYGNPMSLFHIDVPHNLRTYELSHCAPAFSLAFSLALLRSQRWFSSSWPGRGRNAPWRLSLARR